MNSGGRFTWIVTNCSVVQLPSDTLTVTPLTQFHAGGVPLSVAVPSPWSSRVSQSRFVTPEKLSASPSASVAAKA
jgi:hypothetical protein